jgi:cell division protease FtsH
MNLVGKEVINKCFCFSYNIVMKNLNFCKIFINQPSNPPNIMGILEDFKVTHNLSSNEDAESALRSLISVVDEQPRLEQILENKENWDMISRYKAHAHEVFLDLENVDETYNHFLEADITGLPDKATLTQTDSGYTLELSHRGKHTKIMGAKEFKFDPDFKLLERIEKFEGGTMPAEIPGNSVSINIDGDRIVEASSYSAETGLMCIEKDRSFSKRKKENSDLMMAGHLVPSESFIEYCKGKRGDDPSDAAMAELVQKEGLDEDDIDFEKSKAYVKDEKLYLTGVTEKEKDEIIEWWPMQSNLNIMVDVKELFKKPKLRVRMRRRFRKNKKLNFEYVLEEATYGQRQGSSALATADNMGIEDSVHRVVYSDRTFDDIGGQDAAKRIAYRYVNSLKKKKRALRLGKTEFAKAALLLGPPGTGKTLFAKAIANEASRQGRPLYAISASDLDEKLVGVGASRLRNMFEQAALANAFIFIDEVDAIAASRTKTAGFETGKTLNALLALMDGTRGRVVDVIMASNMPLDYFDSALLSRVDYKITMDSPDYAGRKMIFDIHSRNKVFSYPALAKLDYYAKLLESDGSGRLIEKMLLEAVDVVCERDGYDISIKDLQDSFELAMFGMDGSGNRELEGRAMEVTAYHEAGHAVVAYELFEKGTPAFERFVNMVSIKPMGQAAGFVYTRNFDTNKEWLMRGEYVNQLGVALAGHLSEKIRYNQVSPGARGDLDKVRSMTNSLVLSGVTVDDKIHLDEKSEGFKDATNDLMMQAYSIAERVLNNNPDKIKSIAEALMEEKVLYRDQFIQLVQG